MPGSDYRSLLTTVDRLYSAAVEPAQWNPFLSSAMALFGADHAFVCRMHNLRDLDGYVGSPQPGRERAPVDRYKQLIAEDPRRSLFDISQGRPVHCRMGLTNERLHESRAYRDYLAPLNIEYTMVLEVPAAGNRHMSFGLTRTSARKPFDTANCDLLRELGPHLGRAFAIRLALEANESRSTAASSVQPAAAPVDTAESLRTVFMLSPSEARVATLLFDGKTVAEAAAALGITYDTARQYLKRVFAKTGARRQAELVRLISRTLERAH